MPNPIKAFFDRKKTEAKFKVAGKGQKLGDAAAAQQTNAARTRQLDEERMRKGIEGSGPREATPAQQQAAEAAMARFSQGQEEDFAKKRSQAVIRAQAQRRMQQEKKTEEEIARLKATYGEKPIVELEAPSVCPGVFFHCPLIGPEVLPKDQMKAKIKEFLYQQLEQEKGLTAALIIHTFAKEDKGKICVDTMCKYLENILQNPEDEKYRKIRKSNKAFLERVAVCEGHDLFLEAAGFQTQTLDGEDYWIYDGELSQEQKDMMESLKDALIHSEPIRAELDRGLKVLFPNQAKKNFSLPPDFFALNADEIRREQQAMTEMVEREGMLRTKAMREREEQKEKRKYRYTLIRIRFPNGIVLQGTFSIYGKYRVVHDFVTECLETPLPFVLHEAAGNHRLEVHDYDKSLLDLSLVPSAILIFAWHPEVRQEVEMQLGKDYHYLKEDVRSLLTDD